MTLAPRDADHLSVLQNHSDAVASTAEVMEWIREVVAHGIRRPGSQPGRRIEDWCAAKFVDMGLEDVRREAFDVPVWEPGSARLVAWPADRPDHVVEVIGFPLPYTRPTQGHEAELVILDADADADADRDSRVEGAIAVDVVQLAELPPSYMSAIATDRVDPGGELEEYVHLLPFSSRLGREVDSALNAGASGFVGVLAGMPWDTHDYYVPYDAVDRPLPALWVDRDAGVRLVELITQGPARGRIEVDARRRVGQSANVLGCLPGASEQWVVIGSHHDAPWASAVEDASGIALVLAQARFWARVPVAERPHNLLFLLNGGHMAGGTGFLSFLERHRELLDDIVLAVHLEHAAAACRIEDGRLVATEDPEVRWWFTTPDPALEAAVAAALRAENVSRSWVLPPDVFGPFPPTDGGYFHMHGVPLVDFLSAPVYLFDACDTLDKVHEPSLVPITRATIRIVESVTGRRPADLRVDRPVTRGAVG